ncbi:MAG TPA: WD40 repeat domain-containing protein [Oligoflexus sp.]|uniref:WD40 repeat domain-containing protein n=1 Tax=Oligoflexus sp. TaxID=1971216 RepID=UPI002D69DC5D|nr:WD40 repeat domain-containing protein [Oligoflexus sp.]HYX36943.1 WD40 repeat domain-containing protein [Oligoflexus sp.]
MPRHINIIILLILAISGCEQLSNRVDSTTLECGEDFVANDNHWLRAESSSGILLTKNEFEVIRLGQESWQTQEISSKGCFRVPIESEWIVRSVINKESRLIDKTSSLEFGHHRLRLEPNRNDILKLACPMKAVNSKNLTFDQIFKIASEGATRLAVKYELHDANSKISIEANSWLLGNEALPLISSKIADGTYHLKFQIQDLRQDQIRNHECNVKLDNAPPEVDADRSHLTLDTTAGKSFFVIPRQEQLRFKSKVAEKDEVRVEYCFVPADETGVASTQACSLDKVRMAAVGEPISPSVNAGIWELHFSAVDTAGNRSEWQHITPLLYADSSTMQQIKLESRPDMVQTELTKVDGIFDILHKAFSNYSTWKSLVTDFERKKTEDAIASLFYAAHIGMNNYSQFISVGDRTTTMTMTPDGEKIFTGLLNGDIQVFDVSTKKLHSTLKGHWASPASYSLSPDNKMMVTGSFDRSIKIWDLEKNNLVTTISSTEGEFLRVALSPDKKNIVSSSWDRIVKIWSIDGTLQKTISKETDQNFHQDVIFALKISPDGKYFATGSWDRTVKLWDLATGTFLRKFTIDHTDGVNDIEFSRDSSLLISAGKDGQILVHNVADGSLQKKLASLSASVTSIDIRNKSAILRQS